LQITWLGGKQDIGWSISFNAKNNKSKIGVKYGSH